DPEAGFVEGGGARPRDSPGLTLLRPRATFRQAPKAPIRQPVLVHPRFDRGPMSTHVEPTAARDHARGRLNWPPDALAGKALEVPLQMCTPLHDAPSGPAGWPLGIAHFGTALYFQEISLDPANPKWEGRHLWRFACRHVTPVIYSPMADRRYFPVKDLLKFR